MTQRHVQGGERAADGRAEPRAITQWLITAAACTTLVCLTGWPRPTLYALVSITGAVLALAALRAGAGHRPGPDPDGPDEASAQVDDRARQIIRTESGPAPIRGPGQPTRQS